MNDPFAFEPNIFLSLLTQHVRVLSQPAEAQAGWLTEHDLPAQELWLEFDDYMTGLDEADRQGVVTPAARKALEELYAFLDSLTDMSFAGPNALTRPEWVTVRTLAAAAADELT